VELAGGLRSGLTALFVIEIKGIDEIAEEREPFF
jgi:hypothetical protein